MRSGTPSRTAQFVAYDRALGTLAPQVPGFSDSPALEFLPANWKAKIARTRRSLAGKPGKSPYPFWMRGMGLFNQFRTVVLDRAIASAAPIAQLVILGAGFDTRAWRLAALENATVSEVDHPATQALKRARAATIPAKAREVRFVATDFHRDDMAASLRAAGYDASRPAFWLREGVTVYLRPEALAANMAALTYMSKDRGRIPRSPFLALLGEPARSAYTPAEITDLGAACVAGWHPARRWGVPCGPGAIATAGIFGILKSMRVEAGSFAIAARAFRHDHHDGDAARFERTDRDISVVTILIGVIFSAVGVAILPGNLAASLSVILVGLGLTLLFSFFFTSVAANALATTARNPVSGMTMLIIIISSLVLCTALSTAGQAITDFKTGYWLGSTPAAQEKVKFLGVIASSVAVGLTIVLLASPQASIMKALVVFMSRQPVAYILFAAGAFIAVIMEMLGVPALIFALGMYLPLELNTPALVGGFLAHFRQRSEKAGGARGSRIRERGVIIASGLMAGGALGGVLGAACRLIPGFTEDWIKTPFYGNEVVSQSISATLFIFMCAYLWYGSLDRSKETK